MKKKNIPTLPLFAFLIVGLFLASCEKYDKNIEGDVNIYLLEEYTTRESSSAIISSGLVLSEEPVLYYNEILEYNSNEYIFKLSASGADRIADLFGSAFALAIDGEIIYTGYFWASYSSAIVDWVSVDLIWAEISNEMRVQIGYPGTIDGWQIPDDRNDNRILSVFARDNKLVD